MITSPVSYSLTSHGFTHKALKGYGSEFVVNQSKYVLTEGVFFLPEKKMATDYIRHTKDIDQS